jgi:hypothetical protein
MVPQRKVGSHVFEEPMVTVDNVPTGVPAAGIVRKPTRRESIGGTL